ncbi:MAG: DUF2608 domain-containing protein [Rickettsiales bacterium]|nr:MAG: DUF2608 domain-containing protein [Rickettsiales bacterium]
MNNLLVKITVLVVSIFLVHNVSAELITAPSLDSSSMKEMINWVDKDTTIIIAVDDVITIPKSKMFALGANPNKQFINNLVSLSKQQPAYKTVIASWFQQRQIKLVDENWISFIENAKAKGATIYGLCSMPIQLTNIEEKRYLELKHLGINFSSEVNKQSQLIISSKQKWASSFYKGIIFIGPYSKSQAILDFIRVTNHIPPKLLVIDSVDNDLSKIDNSLKIFNMYFYNVHYQGAKNALDKPNPDIVKLQQQQLILNLKWLEDDAAEKLLLPASQ